MDFIFQSSLLIIPRLLAGSHLWIGAVIRADDRCAQLFRHLPGQQTVNGSFSRAPRASIDEDHQRRRPIFQPAHVWREVQVQFLAPPAKCDALQSVHSIRLLAFMHITVSLSCPADIDQTTGMWIFLKHI